MSRKNVNQSEKILNFIFQFSAKNDQKSSFEPFKLETQKQNQSILRSLISRKIHKSKQKKP